MKKYYSQPELEIRRYALAQSEYVTTSDLDDNIIDNGNDLNKDDKYEYFGD